MNLAIIAGAALGVIMYLIVHAIERKELHDQIKREHPYWPDLKEQKRMAKKLKKSGRPLITDPNDEPIGRYFNENGLKVSQIWRASDMPAGLMLVFDRSVTREDILAFQKKHLYLETFTSIGMFCNRIFLAADLSDPRSGKSIVYEEWMYITFRDYCDKEDLDRWTRHDKERKEFKQV